jgi:hypothetical protein
MTPHNIGTFYQNTLILSFYHCYMVNLIELNLGLLMPNLQGADADSVFLPQTSNNWPGKKSENHSLDHVLFCPITIAEMLVTM